jgi:hypothetical protein
LFCGLGEVQKMVLKFASTSEHCKGVSSDPLGLGAKGDAQSAFAHPWFFDIAEKAGENHRAISFWYDFRESKRICVI